MGFERAIQSLSFIEEKLRRAFNLAGPIGARLQPDQVTPVVIAHDLRTPGHSSSLGRCWAWSSSVTAGSPGIISVLTLLCQADVLIEAIGLTGTLGANNVVTAYVTTPSETIPVAAAINEGAWRDRKTVAADVPPLFSNSAGAWAAPTGTVMSQANRVASWRGNAGGTSEGQPREVQIMIPAGGTLTFRADAANAVIPYAWGRIWP